ncbi:MAG: MBL fold metallo-hydrolase [Clostridiales bacterium]|nr:MBL fold metallo-hydrolase [Clostridiales bacterium]
MEREKVTILGARGSVPVSGAKYAEYGGATACVLLETTSEILVFDAGSGILNLPEHIWKEHKRIHLFLSHFHIDHLMGIPMSPMMYDEDIEILFYAADKAAIEKALNQMMKEPLWAIGTDAFLAKTRYCSVSKEPYPVEGSSITVKTMQTTHPGGSLAYRIEWEEKSVVYATDCELDEEESRRMEQFAKDATLFILDAQYTGEEYENCRGYGHTAMERSASVIAGSASKKGLLFHHAPTHTDDQLYEIEKQLHQRWNQVTFAKEGDIITL